MASGKGKIRLKSGGELIGQYYSVSAKSGVNTLTFRTPDLFPSALHDEVEYFQPIPNGVKITNISIWKVEVQSNVQIIICKYI